MLQPSNFPTLTALLFDWKQSLQPSSEDEYPSTSVVPATPLKPWHKTLFQRLRPSLKRDFDLKLRKNTILLPGNVPPKPHPQSWFNGQSARPIYALIIGVDSYQHLPRLHGAVSDANAFSHYVKTELKVPAESVVDLRNEEAYRAGILRAFHALGQRSERRPRRDDSIIIYYAGYGGPLESSLDGVQSIIPADYSDAADNAISAVTSAEILERLSEVKRTKGDNITIIFDCGGSLQKEKGAGKEYVSSRVVTLAKANEANTPANTVVSGNVFVLSAYSAGEAAREVQGRGLFTTRLVKLLKREGASNTTRANILTRLPQITSQTPQAHGGITDSPIFSTGLVPPEQIAYQISVERDQYTVHAGSVAGITPGTQFFVYRDKSRLSKRKPKVFVADHISLFTTSLKPLIEAPLKPLLNAPGAIPFGAGQRHDLVVFTPIKDALTPLYQVALKLLYTSTADSYQFFFTENQDKADISLDISEDAQFLQIIATDDRVALHGFKHIPAIVPLKNDDIERFLLNAAHYYRQLNYSSPHPDISIKNDVSVEFLRLVDSDTDYDDYGRPYRSPVGNDLFASGIAEVQIDPDDPDNFGFKITNNANRDLYPHVFYLDNSDFSIVKYHPQEEQTPIKKDGGILTIGYDNPATTAYSYFVREGQEMDVGFIKVFFSEAPIDLPSIPQTTIYQEMHREPIAGKQKESESKAPEMLNMVPAPDKDVESIWGSVMFCIVQRRLQEDLY